MFSSISTFSKKNKVTSVASAKFLFSLVAAIVNRNMGLLVAVVNVPFDITVPVVYPDPEQSIVVGY